MNKIKRERNPCIYITGDKHRDFKSVFKFCKKNKTTQKDILIVLGDAGFNYYGGHKDERLKKKISKLNITLFCIQGNKEKRPQNIPTYKMKEFMRGLVFYEEKYPNIIFAKDCGVYNFNGSKAIVIGGAQSSDKMSCIKTGAPWWCNEEPDEGIKKEFEQLLRKNNYKVDYIFSHTVPFKFEPAEMFITNMAGGNGSKLTKHTERWLDSIEDITSYKKWYCGHYHTDKLIAGVRIMNRDIERLNTQRR